MDAPGTEWSLFYLTTTIPLQSIDLLAKALRKLVANFILVKNPISSVVRFQILKIFNKTKLDKLNNFLFQCQLNFCTNSVQFTTDAVTFILTTEPYLSKRRRKAIYFPINILLSHSYQQLPLGKRIRT